MFLLSWQTLFRVSDTGMNVLFMFIATFLSFVSSKLDIAQLNDFIRLLPQNTSSAKKLIGNTGDSFTKYASCPSCHSIYLLDSCKVIQPDKNVHSKQCTYVKFPHHPRIQYRKACNTLLLKKVKTSTGSISLYPRQLFCYRSLVESLKDLVCQPGFYEKCELWRKRKTVEGVLMDIYDGKVWKEFLSPGGIPFLSLPYNFALCLNVDWFQPFKNTCYSVGAMYVSVLNLPRNERYATNNVILLGIIPGPNEPKKTMNSYLQPLVNDLLTLWKGVVMISAFGTPVIVRAALICTSCDIPASRKVSGFVGHSAYRACSKCLKAFPTEHFGEKPDYSGTERNSWTPRCMDSHYEHAMQYKNACTQEQRKDIEHKFGCRYSALIELPYYDVIRFCVIDPMHNLLLGTAKHMIKVWTEIGILDKTHFTRMQDKVNCFTTPEIGRIPSKIASGFASLTAEQWRNWILVYSLCCLKDILPHHHYDCWLLFVKAISILCQRKVTVSDLHKLLMEFSETFQSLYGKKYYTINICIFMLTLWIAF